MPVPCLTPKGTVVWERVLPKNVLIECESKVRRFGVLMIQLRLRKAKEQFYLQKIWTLYGARELVQVGAKS